jgi:hypothetical protein
MIVKSIAPLMAAATGKPIVTEPEEPSPLRDAMSSRIMPAATGDYSTFATSMGLPSTVNYSTQGLSPKGKYSGFNTASDLETAISGQAYSQNQQANAWAEGLRSLATKRAEQVSSDEYMLGQQALPASRLANEPSRMTQLPAETVAYRRSQLAQVAPQVQEQYQRALGTYQQVQDTPMSQYAQAIATRQYGMNPALAAGTFGTEYDVKAMNNLLNQQSMESTGLPLDAYKAAIAQQRGDLNWQSTQRSLNNEKYLADVSAATAVDAKKLATASNLSPEQLAGVVGSTYQIEGGSTTFVDEALNIQALMGEGKYNDAYGNARALIADPATSSLGMALLGYVNMLAQMANLGGSRAINASAYASAIPGMTSQDD